ncbi:hypothetical protein EYB26_007173 [Talaromyces marneffei]|uniref:Cell wall protein 1 n=1 Tax=Talaromyces marneffei PM1 TaxID=1077442 RepID=A0A093V857_TALMA|nr:uncharacterized protein EYB26_007173 [Talaromyces marneffei]QGA19484.1 hypothetical protein EYB26_007173 [Talaromyces marneffei]
MKFTTGVISGLALCVVNVAAQNFGALPPCAQACATNSIPPSCGLDVRCICSATSFITGVSCCVATSCNAADQQATLQFAVQLCAGAGVTSLPSAAACPSTTGAAPSGAASTAASTAVPSAKTSASAVSSAATSAMTSATGTASSSAASTSHTGAANPMAKSNGVAAAGVGAAAILAAMCLV